MMYPCCYIDNLSDDVVHPDACDWKNQLGAVLEYRTGSNINV